MKIALACQSVLLEKSLRKFLKNRLVGEYEADIVISDHTMECDRPVLRIGTDPQADLKKPFSRSQLMIRLEERYDRFRAKERIEGVCEEEPNLEERIETLTRRFVNELTHMIKEHYEKRT